MMINNDWENRNKDRTLYLADPFTKEELEQFCWLGAVDNITAYDAQKKLARTCLELLKRIE